MTNHLFSCCDVESYSIWDRFSSDSSQASSLARGGGDKKITLHFSDFIPVVFLHVEGPGGR